MDELNWDEIFGDIREQNAKYFAEDRVRRENAPKRNVSRGDYLVFIRPRPTCRCRLVLPVMH